MDIRHLTDRYAVSPQIEPEHLARLREAGFTTIIDNRPDAEIPVHLHAAPMRQAAEAAGFRFVLNPVIGGAISMENVNAQRDAIVSSDGPVLAYCASGNRSSIVWALGQAGARPTSDLIASAARWGYNLEPFRPQIDALANGD